MHWLKSKTNNLQKMYIIRALRSGMFSIAIIVLFFKEHGLSMGEITLLQSLFSAAVILFELPTGHFADNYGRKKSIVIGGLVSSLGYVFYSLSSTFWGFLAGEIILALGCSFVSGADSAIIYENTDQTQGLTSCIKTEGNSASAGMVSEGVTSFIGGSFLALVSLRFPLYFDILLALAVIPVALTLHEAEKPRKQKRENIITTIWRVMKYSLREHVELRWLIIYSAVITASTLTMVWFIQIYWEAVHIPIVMFGGLWAVFMCISAIVSMKVHAIESKLGRKKALFMLIILPVAGYFFLGAHLAKWSIIFIALFYAARGMNNPIMKSYVNGLVNSDERAKILSVQSAMGRLMFMIIGPIMGLISDTYSLQVALLTCAGVYAILGIISLLFMHKNRLL
jgi:MFS family permease